MLGTRTRGRRTVSVADAADARTGTTADLYAECGQRAFAVARGLTRDRVAAEQIVVDVFVAVDRLPRCINAATERQRVFADIVTRCADNPTSEADREATARGCSPWRQRVAIALTSLGRCSLDDVATILAADRIQIAQDIRTALHAVT